jgi:hypothetical protein
MELVQPKLILVAAEVHLAELELEEQVPDPLLVVELVDLLEPDHKDKADEEGMVDPVEYMVDSDLAAFVLGGIQDLDMENSP